MRLRRRVINSDVEKQVLIGLITSDKVCHTLKNLLDPNLFQLEVGKKVSFWIKEYYSLYNRAPGKDIQEIYLAERSNLDEEVSKDINQFLQTLSEDYLKNPPNEEYLLNQSTTYLRKQCMLAGIKEANALIENGNGDLSSLSAAEAAMGKYARTTAENTQAFDPLDPKIVREFMKEIATPLLVLDEPLGSFIGPLHRGYVLGIMASQKRGKTWWVQNFAINAIEEGLRVVFISLEMPKQKLAERFWKQLGGFADKDGNYEFPIFDCEKNKFNSCAKEERTSHVKHGEEGYIPCTKCKEKDGLKLTITLKSFHKKGITLERAVKKVKDFSLMYGRKSVRFFCYPMFSAKLSQIINDIDALEWREGFIPDVIILDYPAILQEERVTEKGYESFGETFKTIKRIAEEKQVLFIVPLQTDRSGSDSTRLKIKNTAGFVQVIAHLDICITLNQQDKDYDDRIMRIGKIADRWTEMSPGKELIALTQLQCAQPYLGARLEKVKSDKK